MESAGWPGLIREYEPAWHCFGVLGEAVRVASQLSPSLFVPKRPNSGTPKVAFIAPREDNRTRGNLGSLRSGLIAVKSARREFEVGFTSNDYTPSAVFTRSGEGYMASREDSRTRGNFGSLSSGLIAGSQPSASSMLGSQTTITRHRLSSRGAVKATWLHVKIAERGATLDRSAAVSSRGSRPGASSMLGSRTMFARRRLSSRGAVKAT